MPNMFMRPDANGNLIGFPSTDGDGVVLTSTGSGDPKVVDLSNHSHVGLLATGANNAGVAYFSTQTAALAWVAGGPVSDPFIVKPASPQENWYSVPDGKPFLAMRGQDLAVGAVLNVIFPTNF